jgi:hypothetical protein
VEIGRGKGPQALLKFKENGNVAEIKDTTKGQVYFGKTK